MSPQRLWGSGEKDYFLGSLEALLFIFMDLGSNLIVRRIYEALQKVKHEFKKAHLNGKAYISFYFF